MGDTWACCGRVQIKETTRAPVATGGEDHSPPFPSEVPSSLASKLTS